MMKRNLLLFLMVILPFMASAYDIEIEGIYYNVIKKAKRAEVTYGTSKYTGDIKIPATIEVDGVTCDVVAIGDQAFRACSKLVSIHIPNSVTSMGQNVFYGCTNLATVVLSDNITIIESGTFYACRSLSSLTIPSNLTGIGSNAFQGCSSLIAISIPNSVTTLGSGAFMDCANLQSVNTGDGITTINKSTFSSCVSLTSVTIGKKVWVIGEQAFAYCTQLASVRIPGTVGTIGVGAFRNCSSLTTVDIGKGVTKIERNAFVECSSLVSLNIPGSVTSIGNHAFRSCTSLSSLTFEYGNLDLTLGDYAFQYCSSLTTVLLPNNITSIGDYAFQYCKNLTTVCLPRYVTEIGICAFANCKELTDVYCLDVGLTDCSSSAFSNSDIGYATLHVPEITLPFYQILDGWKNFGTIVALKKGDPGYIQPEGIPLEFTDVITALLCLIHYDSNGDYQISLDEAAAVTNIGNYFSGRAITYFDELYWFTNLQSIPDNAFEDCMRLQSIDLPDRIKTIGYRAFYNCISLKEIWLPASLESITLHAFYNCDNLQTVLCFAKTPPKCDSQTFEVPRSATLYVPIGCKTAYENAKGWDAFYNVVEMDATLSRIMEHTTTAAPVPPVVYDLNGHQHTTPHKGLNIINGKKVIIR